MDKSKLVAGLVALLIVVALFVFLPLQNSADRELVQTWANEQGHKLVKVERHYWTRGPYWICNDGERIYRAEIEGGRAFWFRFGLFRTNIEPGD